MNEIKKQHISSLGYNFIPPQYIPEGKNEYYLRNMQNRSGIKYRQLTALEIETLVRNSNSSDNWNNVLVSEAFNPELVKNCKFFGLVRIGKLEPAFLEFHAVRMQVGLYNSTIISCDFGDNVVVDNVNYLSHYIVGNSVIIANVNELATTNYSKFGNGILKEGEDEKIRIWLEICNENAGRSVIPFNGMLPGDAFLWSRYRDDGNLQEKFKEFTQKSFTDKRGYYGKIGDRTVIKNSRIIKDVWIGSDTYIKGANKLKNLTINSSPQEKSQIGEGCELVNGIVGFGCRIFYGAKAVRFFMASNSQLKYGARLINSYLGNNATISCCEVLNSLIFPAHEQHHNNSFLCAAVVMGQSNMAAGATIGSNHNSRSADGEIIAGRGFWPGLCVSLKHNSKFATYTLIAKGDYSHELNIPVPFSLVSIDSAEDKIVIMPGYWFMYNMYALARNAWKYIDRDKRQDKTQLIEYDFLAPDSVNELIHSLTLMEFFTGKAFLKQQKSQTTLRREEYIKLGKQLLLSPDKIVDKLEILAEGFENSKRKVELIKVQQAYHLFRELVIYYGVTQIFKAIQQNKISSFESLKKQLPTRPKRTDWINVGGQLIEADAIEQLKTNIKNGKIKSWDGIHSFYKKNGDNYPKNKLNHAFASLLEILSIPPKKLDKAYFKQLLQEAVDTKEWITKGIYNSRAKDYTNPFRKMVYESTKEMDTVIGKLEENSFIKAQQTELSQFKKKVKALFKQYKL
ncbi:MAG TPA: DUF4954 family protein [Chitinophagaceae bacterium]|nr:DUF4954 family protein [Chitinophagaceae bacterium]